MNDRGNVAAIASPLARRAVLRGIVVAPVAFSLSGCGAFAAASYRFRMTVEVDTPGGIRSGSSVYEVAAQNLVALTSEEAHRRAGVRGQALIVDLPDAPLFVLLKVPDSGARHDLAQMSMAVLDRSYQGDWTKSARRIGRSWSTLRGEIAKANWPMMVRFKDINDPMSLEPVDPNASGIRQICLETVTADVTTGIEKRLPWLVALRGGYLNGGSSSRGSPLGLDRTAFSTEIR